MSIYDKPEAVMEGKNELEMNQATMRRAVQLYVDSLIPRHTPVVVNVAPASSKGMDAARFIITLDSDADRPGPEECKADG